MKTTLAFTILIALAAAIAAGIPRAAETPSHSPHCFTGLGDLAGGASYSTAFGVSADGSVVVGYSSSDTGIEAFRWTRRGGMVGLGFQQAFAASEDGSAVVGYRLIAGKSEPIRWTERGGLQGLGNIAGYECGDAHGVSADGSVVVGSSAPHDGPGQIAFRWTPACGIARLEPLPAVVLEVDPLALSSKGEVVVGAIRYQSGCRTAFRWTSQTGFVDLGVLPGDTGSIAHAVSADGSVVVGGSGSSCTEAFRWTQQAGMVRLGMLPGGSCSCALGVSADGSVIVGQNGGAFGGEAFVWDAVHGMRSVRQLLMSETDLDTSLRGWKLRSAMAVSRDGSVIVGFGINPKGNREAWIARLGDKPLTEAPALRIAVR